MFNLLLNGALEGELELWCTGLSGDGLLGAIEGGLKTTFVLDEAFLIGLRGDEVFGVEQFMDGIGAWS